MDLLNEEQNIKNIYRLYVVKVICIWFGGKGMVVKTKS